MFLGSHTTTSLHYKLLQHPGSAVCWNSCSLHIAVHTLLCLGQGDAGENRMKGENIQGLLHSFPLKMSYCTWNYFHFFCFEFNLNLDCISSWGGETTETVLCKLGITTLILRLLKCCLVQT